MSLMEKIKRKEALVGVIGLGYVGLPLAVEKAKAGFDVLGFDIQPQKVEWVNEGRNYIGDVVDEELADLVKRGKLRATTNFDELASCDVVAICVPTPLDRFKQPDLTYVINTSVEISKRLHPQMLVVLESTTYPGTTEEVVLPILEKSGLKVGEDFYLAFSPERVDPGNKRFKTKNTPKIVGGVTPACTEHAKALYEAILDAEVFTVSSPKEAEMTKILENTFRIVNIALVNEMAIVAKKMGINIWEVIDAAATKPFGFMPFYPGPGVGGHCLRGTEHIFIRKNGEIQAIRIQEMFQKIEPKEGEKIAIPQEHIEVLSWDPWKNTPIWKPVQILTRRIYDGKMIHVKTQLGRILAVTANHPMIVRENDQWKVKYAKDLKIGDELPIVGLKLKTKNSKSTLVLDVVELLQKQNSQGLFNDIRVKPHRISFKDIKDRVNEALKKIGVKYETRREYIRWNFMPLEIYIKIEEMLPLDRSDLRLYTGRGNMTTIPATIHLNEDFMRFLGYYVAEGCVSKGKKERYGVVRISFNEDETDLISDVTEFLKSLSIKYSIYKDKKRPVIHIKISSRLFAWLLSEALGCGYDSYTARVPKIVFESPENLIKAFLSGLFRGDGWVTISRNSPVIGFGTSSNQLAEEVVILLQSMGIVPSLKIQNAKKSTRPLVVVRIFGSEQVLRMKDLMSSDKQNLIMKTFDKQLKRVHKHRFSLSSSHAVLKVTDIKEEYVSEPVYSMEVEETHSFVTSGGVVVHNCIPIDPFYLTYKAREYDYHTRLIELAGEINDYMPEYVVDRLAELLNERKKCLNGSKVLVLGVAYKGDVGDIRESPALKVIQHLEKRHADVVYHDPYVPEFEVNGKKYHSVELSKELLKSCDAVVITTAHKNGVDYRFVIDNAFLVFDTKNITKDVRNEKDGNVYLL